MIPNPETKYRPFPPVSLPDRQWPARTHRQAPIWLSTDLRDGNQALFDPMSRPRKLRFFDALVGIGFREIEVASPNVFADQIEWMDRNLDAREHIVLSVHTHNDRGTGVACAELAMLAGAQRVEGCLFGNGERSGNVDLITLALNLYTQGIAPGLDFSDLPAIARCYEECTGMTIPPRHPYAGDLVYTAFSGSHQDAIKKGSAAQDPRGFWEVPYLPIDPADLGRSYDGVVRINSQSGKGGVSYLLERDHGVVLPRAMQAEFHAIVQRHADATAAEIGSETLRQLFESYQSGRARGHARGKEQSDVDA